MAEFKAGDKVVHLGGVLGEDSPNRGRVFGILDGPYKIVGWSGQRYIVDGPVHVKSETIYHVNADYLLRLKTA